MTKRKSDLVQMCKVLGITLEPIKYKNIQLIKLIQAFYLEQNKGYFSFGLLKAVEIESVMLSARFTDLSCHSQYQLFNSSDWIAEAKINGCRVLLSYDPDEGFNLITRNLSDETFLPLDHTHRVLFKCGDLYYSGSYFKDMFKKSFILDCEIKLDGGLDLSIFNRYGVFDVSEQNQTNALLTLDYSLCQQIQKQQCSLSFFAFDILYYDDKWITDYPLRRRKNIQQQIVNLISRYIPIQNTELFLTPEAKLNAWLYQQSIDGDGIVFKALDKQYNATEKRDKDTQVKLKPYMSIDLTKAPTSDIDCFIMGGVVKGSVLDTLKFGVYDFNDNVHCIGTLKQVQSRLSKDLTIVDTKGKTVFNPDFVGKVCIINGHSLSPTSLKLRYINPDIVFRTDKSQYQCKIDLELLEKF